MPVLSALKLLWNWLKIVKTGDSISKWFDIAEDIDIGGNVAREIVCGIAEAIAVHRHKNYQWRCHRSCAKMILL